MDTIYRRTEYAGRQATVAVNRRVTMDVEAPERFRYLPDPVRLGLTATTQPAAPPPPLYADCVGMAGDAGGGCDGADGD
jgi:hypothetical protein